MSNESTRNNNNDNDNDYLKHTTYAGGDDKNKNFDISILENRVFALEQFLGSSSNTIDMDAASFQNQSSVSSTGSVFPLIDSITRYYHRF